VSLLTLPSAAVLVVRVFGFDDFKTFGANEDPYLRFVDADSVKDVVCLLAAIARFGADAFDWHSITAAYFVF
jgi:hypothetical protein